MEPEDELAAQRRRRRFKDSPEEDRFATLSEHVGTGRSVNLKTHCPDERVHGYILGLSREVVLMHTFADFDPNGYELIPVAEVAELRAGENERFWEGIVSAEGRLDGLRLDLELDLASLETAIAGVARRYPDISVECSDDTFVVGRVLGIADGELRVHSVDSLGQWDPQPERIRVDEIARLHFATPYLALFMKHCPPPPPLNDG
jgi:hypothetical protein